NSIISHNRKRKSIFHLSHQAVFYRGVINRLIGTTGKTDIHTLCQTINERNTGNGIVQSEKSFHSTFNTAETMGNHEGELFFPDEFRRLEVYDFQSLESSFHRLGNKGVILNFRKQIILCRNTY